MPFLRLTAGIIGLSQIILAALYLALPTGFVAWQGMTAPAADIGYPLAMLAARFLVYGIGMFRIARDPAGNLFWARGMVAIQMIDLAAGAAYLALGLITPATAVLPMVNAALFALALQFALSRLHPATPAHAV